MRVLTFALALIAMLVAIGIAGPPPAAADCSGHTASIVAADTGLQLGGTDWARWPSGGGEKPDELQKNRPGGWDYVNVPAQSGDPPGLLAVVAADNLMSVAPNMEKLGIGADAYQYTYSGRIHAGGYAGAG